MELYCCHRFPLMLNVLFRHITYICLPILTESIENPLNIKPISFHTDSQTYNTLSYVLRLTVTTRSSWFKPHCTYNGDRFPSNA